MDEHSWNPYGHVQMLSRQKGRNTLLEALNLIPASLEGTNQPDVGYPSGFEEKAWIALRRFYNVRRQHIPVEVTLEEENDYCKIVFSETEEQSRIHEMNVRSISETTSILRSGYSLQSTIDNDMTWNLFQDIDYGKFDSLKSLVETDAAIRTKLRIPTLLCDLFDSGQEQLKLILTHDETNCPILKDGIIEHGSCWKLLPSLGSEVDTKGVFPLMTGEEAYALLSRGVITLEKQNYSFNLEFIPGYDNSEFSVFQENKWILRFLREQGMNLYSLPVGSFIGIKREKWKAVINPERTFLTWNLISTVTGRQYGEGPELIQFDSSDSNEKIVEVVCEKISSIINSDEIINYELFKRNLKDALIDLRNL